MSETSFVGEPVFYGDEKKSLFANRWRIDKPGSHIYRILPPCGLLAQLGRWSFYESIHWGFRASNGKQRPFRCIQRKDGKSKMIVQECPACTQIAARKLEFDAKEKHLISSGKSPEEIKEILTPFATWFREFNNEKFHSLNALKPDLQIGNLKIKIRQKQALDLEVKELRERHQINPVNVKGGVWFDFQRLGLGRDTTYPVKVVKEEVVIQGRKLESIKEAPLTDEVLKRMEKEASELSTAYKDLTYEQVKMLVNSNGDPEVVDSVFGTPRVADMSTSTSTFNAVEEVDESVESEETEANVAADSQDLEAKLLAQLASLKASKQEAKTTKMSDMSAADFVNAFKTGNV
jgi:hypothetical protein